MHNSRFIQWSLKAWPNITFTMNSDAWLSHLRYGDLQQVDDHLGINEGPRGPGQWLGPVFTWLLMQGLLMQRLVMQPRWHLPSPCIESIRVTAMSLTIVKRASLEPRCTGAFLHDQMYYITLSVIAIPCDNTCRLSWLSTNPIAAIWRSLHNGQTHARSATI